MGAIDLNAASLTRGNAHYARAAAAIGYSPASPCKPIIRPLLQVDSGRRARWIQHKQRRALILAEARGLIAERGYERSCVREIARRSGITVPTVHKLVGHRDQLAREALYEEFEARLEYSIQSAREENVNPLICYAKSIWITAKNDPDYCKQALRALTTPASDALLCEVIWTAAARCFVDWLAPLRVGVATHKPIHLPVVADLTNRQLEGILLRWSHGVIGLEDLRHELTAGVAIILLAVADKSQAAQIEAWLEECG